MENNNPIYLITDEQINTLVSRVVKEIMNAKETTLPAPFFHTQTETANILHCSIPSLIEYRKRNWIKGRAIGGKILFTDEDISEGVKTIAVAKYKRV